MKELFAMVLMQVKAGTKEFPEVIPVHTFCEATEDEIKEALQRAGKPTRCIAKIFDFIDEKVRNACFDPFKVTVLLSYLGSEGSENSLCDCSIPLIMDSGYMVR